MAAPAPEASAPEDAAPETGLFLTLELYLDHAGAAWIRGEYGSSMTITPLDVLVTDAKLRIGAAVSRASGGLS